MNGCSGNGKAWGAGIADIEFVGKLYYSSWDDLTSADNHFVIVAASLAELAGTFVVFSAGGTEVGAMFLVGVGTGALLGINGSFKWTYVRLYHVMTLRLFSCNFAGTVVVQVLLRPELRVRPDPQSPHLLLCCQRY